jgi:HNH endonuclease
VTRGQASKPGDTRTAPNGYHYTRTEKEWRLTHHLIAEQVLGRNLAEDERVTFKDKDRKNLNPANIVVSKVGRGSARRRIAQIDARIAELQAQKDELLRSLV